VSASHRIEKKIIGQIPCSTESIVSKMFRLKVVFPRRHY